MVSHCGGGYSRYEDAGGHPLAGRRDPRRHRPVLLREGPRHGTGLVRGPPAGLRAGRLVPRVPRDRPRHLPPRGRRHRDAHRDRRRARGRGRGPARHRHQQRRRRRARSSSPATARSCSRRRTPTARTPRSATCSSRRSGTTGVRAVTATRRPRSAKEQPLWCVHVVDAGRERVGPGDVRDRPRALPRPRALDPRARGARGRRARSRARPARCSIRSSRSATRVRLEPGQSASVAFTTLVATTPRAGLRAGRSLSRPARRAAGARSRVDLEPGRAARARAHARRTPRCSRSSRGISSTPPRARARPQAELRRNRGSQPLLWAMGISGDWPILLATIDSAEGLPTLRQLLAAHRYWRLRGHDGRPGRARCPSPTLPAGPGRPHHRRGLRGRRLGLARPARAACSSGAATCSAPTSCSCSAPPRGCTFRATGGRLAAFSPRPSRPRAARRRRRRARRGASGPRRRATRA